MVDLNSISMEGKIKCPWCNHYEIYSYGARGAISVTCSNCHNIVYIDLDNMVGEKAEKRKYNNNL